MDGLRPDDKTISNFRKDNAKALKGTFRDFCRMCSELGLYGGEVVAIDSVKIRANNSLKNNHNKTTCENSLSRIEKKISEYLNALEEADREEAGEKRPSSSEIKAALERLKAGKEKYEKLSSYLEREKESEVSLVDADARVMRPGGDGRKLDVCYSVQTVVDSKNHFIVDFDISTCPSDTGNLKGMSEKAKQVMGCETLTVLADAGYYDSQDLVSCEGSGVTCLVAKPAAGGPKKAEGFNREDFIYDREKDVYICPFKKELSCKSKNNRKHKSGREYRVYGNNKACRNCQKKTSCTTSEYREVLRLSCQDVLDVIDERTRRNRALYRKRQEIVEHCFGTVKSIWGYRQFLCRGKSKVTGEMALAYLAYNIRRIFNISTAGGVRLATALG
jgi:hypothetical protein